MKTITNMKPTKKPLHARDELAKANDLNRFYKRFDTCDYSAECSQVLESIATDVEVDRWEIDPISVEVVFKKVNVNKASSPDGISAFLLKTCAKELTPAWCPIFQRSVDSNTVPALWKKGSNHTCPQETLPTGE